MSEVGTFIKSDESERTTTFLRVQDVEPIIENNKRLKTTEQRSDWGRHIATIPNVILEQWLHEEMDKGNIGLRLNSEEFDQVIARKLQDPDWHLLRVDR